MLLESVIDDKREKHSNRDRQLADLSQEDPEQQLLMEAELALRPDPSAARQFTETWGRQEADRYVQAPKTLDTSTIEALADEAGF